MHQRIVLLVPLRLMHNEMLPEKLISDIGSDLK